MWMVSKDPFTEKKYSNECTDKSYYSQDSLHGRSTNQQVALEHAQACSSMLLFVLEHARACARSSMLEHVHSMRMLARARACQKKEEGACLLQFSPTVKTASNHSLTTERLDLDQPGIRFWQASNQSLTSEWLQLDKLTIKFRHDTMITKDSSTPTPIPIPTEKHTGRQSPQSAPWTYPKLLLLRTDFDEWLWLVICQFYPHCVRRLNDNVMFDSRLDLGTYGHDDLVKVLEVLFCVAFGTEFFSHFQQVVFVFLAQILSFAVFLANFLNCIASFTDFRVSLYSLVKV